MGTHFWRGRAVTTEKKEMERDEEWYRMYWFFHPAIMSEVYVRNDAARR
jgi:hypothetical protein